jgi:MtN3 and saliva related transmembrane protein
MKFNAEWVGYAATFFSCIGYVPQIMQMWKTKSARDVSLSTYITLITAALLWLSYGFLMHRSAIILANILVMVFLLGIAALKIFYEKQGKAMLKKDKK